MKRYILFFMMTLLGLGLQAQPYKVSTEPQSPGVLLEFFHGVFGYSNSASLIYMEDLKRIYGDNLNLVTIHAGRNAETSRPEYDYTVPDGEEIANWFGMSPYTLETGAINRTHLEVDHGSRVLINSDHWVESIDTFLTKPAPINLWAEAEYDGATRQMHIKVEGYRVSDEWYSDSYLSILLVQNNVTGFQTGAPNHTFEHQHMLRDVLNGTFGEQIDVQQKGFFTREYTYEIPEKYGPVPVKPEDLELVIVFTYSHNYDVKNSITVKPTYKNLDIPFQGKLSTDPWGIADNYCLPYVTLWLENCSDTVVTSARFSMDLNGEKEEQVWTGEIPRFSKKQIRLPIPNDRKLKKYNAYTFTLLEMNGQPVETSTVTYEFKNNRLSLPTEMIMNLQTVDFMNDIHFTLYDIDSGTSQTFGPYENNHIYEEKIHLLPEHRYYLEVENTKLRYGKLLLDLCDTRGVSHVKRGEIAGSGYRIFFRTVREGEFPVQDCAMSFERTGDGELFINDQPVDWQKTYTFNKGDKLHMVFKPGQASGLRSLKINKVEHVGKVYDNVYDYTITEDVLIRAEFDDLIYAGLDEVTPGGPRVYTEAGRLVLTGLEAGESVSIYDTAGKLIFTFTAQSPTLHLDLPKGQTYLVQIAGKTHKVIL